MKVLLYAIFVVQCLRIGAQDECVENAERNAKGKCVCVCGYHGDGEFCCVPDDQKVCMVKGDPMIHTMNGDVIPVDYPCPILISEIHVMGREKDETVKVYASGNFDKTNGILNYDYFRADYEERYNEGHSLVEIVKGQILINGIQHNKTSKSWLDKKHEVEVDYNPTTDRYSIVSMGTTHIHFVRPSKVSKAGIMAHVPGVCIGVERKALLYSLGMCNERKRGLKRSTINKGFPFLQAGVIEHMIRIFASRQDMGPPELRKQCGDIYSLRRRCRDKWNPAVKSCFILIAHPGIRFCLAVAGNDLMSVFDHCLKAHCGLDSKSCQVISARQVSICIKIQPDCQTIK